VVYQGVSGKSVLLKGGKLVSGILAVSLARLGTSLHFLLPCTALGRFVLLYVAPSVRAGC